MRNDSEARTPATHRYALLALPGISLVPLAPDIAIESSQLPGGFRLSLADRIIVATARVLGARFLTSNKSMRAYCKESHVLLA